MAVAVVVDERTTGAPSFARTCDPRFFADLSEGAVAVVVIKHVLAVVGDVQVFKAVVIVIADANALTPAGMREPSSPGDVGKGAVAVVVIQMIGRSTGRGRTIQRRPVDDENVGPAVVVVVKGCHTGAGGLDDVFFCVHAAEGVGHGEAGVLGDVGEIGERLRSCVLRIVDSWKQGE